MHTIDLAYVGRGIHEELVAYVADQQGYYEDEDVHVAIRDGVSWETERLRRGATIGLGRALLSRLTNDVMQVQTAVSETLADLARESIAVIILLGYLFWLDWRLAIVFLTSAPPQ